MAFELELGWAVCWWVLLQGLWVKLEGVAADLAEAVDAEFYEA